MENTLDVKIVNLEPALVASFPMYGPEPEDEGKKKVAAWMKQVGLEPEKTRIFGFDTAGATAASPNRGYEYWVELPAGFQAGDVPVKQFSGGKYAVYRIPKFGNPWETIPSAWQALVMWQEDSPHQMGKGQCLEHLVPMGDLPEAECPMDLYLSID